MGSLLSPEPGFWVLGQTSPEWSRWFCLRSFEISPSMSPKLLAWPQSPHVISSTCIHPSPSSPPSPTLPQSHGLLDPSLSLRAHSFYSPSSLHHVRRVPRHSGLCSDVTSPKRGNPIHFLSSCCLIAKQALILTSPRCHSNFSKGAVLDAAAEISAN